ncbi:MAG: toxic anion resistance protein [Clostridia bacterium]|nr:toxic anion resistance protein [Clostridia bacterium]
MADEIKLTLEPFEDENKKELDSAVQAAVQATEALDKAEAEVKQEVQQATLDMQNFTEEEQQMIDDFSKKIDVRDSNLVFSYGAAAQQNISQFSDAALKNVQTKDLDEVGNMIANLVLELKSFDTDDEEKGGLFGLFKKKARSLETLKAQYDKTEVNVNKIVEGLEQHQIQLLKDIAMLDKLYDQNLSYFKELSMYIVAGKKRLEDFRANELQEARDKAEASKLPEDAQAAKDLADKGDRFEKKLYDLELTRNISIQMAPQIRLIQSSNQIMAEKIQTSLVNTIPLWKSQMVLALGLAHTENAMKAQRAVTDLTNDLLTKNAEKLHMATVETAKEAERGMVDIETLKHTNTLLIETMDEVLEIQQQGKEKRRAAEQELATIEGELRAKILEVRPYFRH